jgi:hypothetical protein
VCLFCAAPFNDWSGHIGGLATGFFLGMVFFGEYIRKVHLRAAWQLLGFAVFIACLGTAINECVNYVAPTDATGDACAFYKSIFMNQDYNCQCRLGNTIYASGSYRYGDDGYIMYVDDSLNDDDGNGGYDEGGGEEGDQQDDDRNNDEDDDNDGEGENDREGEHDKDEEGG